MRNLFYRLIMFIDSVDEDDLNYKIALYMVKNFPSLGKMRINELAAECYVSAATISRFCRELGFENYAELKQECLRAIEHERKLGNLIDVEPAVMRDTPKLASTQFLNQLTSDLENFSGSIDWKKIDRVLQMIHDTEDVNFYGIQFSNAAATHLQGDLMVVGKFTHAPIDIQAQERRAKNATEDSLAIIMSVKGNYMYQSGRRTLNYLERSGCTVVVITSQPEDELPILADYVVPLGPFKSSHSGKHALLALVEMMALRYYTLYNPSFDILRNDIGK
ncbi:MAG: MurR/RpiR family transcriptional regulator [Erysipelotrichaceae bacterium]|nr:MurR/RpiR family transcriptional regulator [Erysipelotrichaceae bacterium]